MSLSDIIIILILIYVLGLVIYFSFIKNKNNKCINCPYKKGCNKNKCNQKDTSE